MKLVKQILKDNKGQAVVLFALMIPVLCGGIGLAVDLGYVITQKQKLQDSADFAVLSGAQKLPDASAAITIAANVFNNNYGEAIPVENIIIDVNSLTIKLHHTDKVSLFFMPLLGINEVTISAAAKAKSAAVYEPSALIPLWISDTLPGIKGGEVTLWGKDKKNNGNFGIVDPAINGKMQNKDLKKWIENDYKGEEGMPAVGDEILTKPGMTTGPVLKGIKARIEKGKNIAICVVIDDTGIQGRDTVEVKGFAAFEISEVVHNGIKGKFIDYVDSKGLLPNNEFSVVDYGVHTINLIE